MKSYSNIKFYKKLGQHFLSDISIINKIVSFISPNYEDVLVEIGSGLGAITIPISNFCNIINIIELDGNLVEILKNRFKSKNKLRIFNKNVLEIDFFKLSEKIGKPIRIFGNLPYNISVHILFHLFKYINIIEDMFFMFQKEVAERICSEINSKKYGRISVISQYFFKIYPLLVIYRNSFVPIPKVDSCFLKFVPNTNIKKKLKDFKVFDLILKAAFSKRRKMIHNNLVNFLNIGEFEKIGISGYNRAENISVNDYCILSNFISSKTYKI